MKKKNIVFLTFLSLVLLLISPLTVFANDIEGWEKKADLPSPRAGAAEALYKGKIYLFGGVSNSDQSVNGIKQKTTFVYDPQSDSWTQKKDMPTSRAAATAVVVNNKIYVIGGYYDSNGKVVRTNVVEIYDPNSDTWQTGISMPTARSWSSASVVNDTIYVVGGTNNSGEILPTVESFNVQTSKWSAISNLPLPLNATSTAVLKNQLYVAGGISKWGDSSSISNKIFEYNPLKDIWEEKESLLTATVASASTTYNNKFYILGSGSDGTFLSTVQVYDSEDNSVSTFQDLSFSRAQSSAAIIDGKLYIIGGTTGESGGILKTVEMYTLIPEIIPDPEPEPSGDRAILTIIMTTGLEKEFDLSMNEVNAFINWYDTKENGIGPAHYGINKHNNNKGPFSKRVDYVVFKNILSFEVSEYTTE